MTRALLSLAVAVCWPLITAGSCATTSEPRIVYRDVKVLVPVPCKVDLPDEPVYATQGLTLDEPLFDLVRAVLVELQQRKARDVEVTAAARSCS